jgi:UPF0271 protein
MKIDLNCDVGETYYDKLVGNDRELIPMVSSCNIACGFHGGDPLTIQKAIEQALKCQTSIGAHPSYPDLENFGRKEMHLSVSELKACLRYQIGALQQMVKSRGGTLKHVKPHGALYNAAAKDFDLAVAIGEVLQEVDAKLIFLGMSNSQMEKAAAHLELPFVREVFADRRYNTNGFLCSRDQKGAVLSSSGECAHQALEMLTNQTVTVVSGQKIPVIAESICIHGDSKNAVTSLLYLKQLLLQNKIEVKSF